MSSTIYLLFLLLLSIIAIIWMTAIKKQNAFFALLITAIGVGLLSGQPVGNIPNILRAGFGHTMEKIGLLIILGTTLGVILEKTGATLSMANHILRTVKEKNAPIAITITGFIVGLPIFCDSGFIILSGLNHSLVQKTHYKMPVMAICLATSLLAVHCLVPPHPGITAAVLGIGGNMGIVMFWGILLAIPATIVGYFISTRLGKKYDHEQRTEIPESIAAELPSAFWSFVPVITPILLITLKSVMTTFFIQTKEAPGTIYTILNFIGDPVIALILSIIISIPLIRAHHKKDLNHWLSDGVHKAGFVLAIIAGGGMFGEMLQATGISKNMGDLLSHYSLGIFFPFLITAILKTAQGSSTVAMITAASLLAPMLPSLGLQSPTTLTLTILSMGAGSMVISHANDAYFWVIQKFSDLETDITLRVYTLATCLMGLTVQLIIWGVYVLLV
jgi:GntP family gluconate:H+ symporter